METGIKEKGKMKRKKQKKTYKPVNYRRRLQKFDHDEEDMKYYKKTKYHPRTNRPLVSPVLMVTELL